MLILFYIRDSNFSYCLKINRLLGKKGNFCKYPGFESYDEFALDNI